MGSSPKHSSKIGVRTYGLETVTDVLMLPRSERVKAIEAANKVMLDYLRVKSPVRTGMFRSSWESIGINIVRDDESESIIDNHIRNMARDGPGLYYGGKIVSPGFRDRRGYPHDRDIPRAKIAAEKEYLRVLGDKIGKNLREVKKKSRK